MPHVHVHAPHELSEREDPPSEAPSRRERILEIGAVLLLSVYAVWLYSYLRTPGGAEPALEKAEAPLGFRPAVAVLAAWGRRGIGIGGCCVFHALDPAARLVLRVPRRRRSSQVNRMANAGAAAAPIRPPRRRCSSVST